MLPGNEKCSVLVVDDEPAISMTLSLILQKEGFQVRPFTEPLEALQAIREGCPDLLISDVVMPHLSGIDLAIAAQDLRPDCKILLLSGQAGTSRLLEDAHGHGHDFVLLSKPVPPKELLDRVQTMLGAGLQRSRKIA